MTEMNRIRRINNDGEEYGPTTEIALEDIACSLHGIVHGDLTQGGRPSGIESLAMALNGEGDNWENNVSSALNNIAAAIRDLAEAVDRSSGHTG